MSNNISYQELLKSEYKKCLESPVYFMKKYVKIQHPIRGTIYFDLYPFQEETLQSFHDYKLNIILKSRQMGISTLVAAYTLWLMVFHKDKNILIISLKQDDAKEVISKIRFANDHLPVWLKVKCDEDNRLSLKLANGSQVKAAATTKKSGVGHALSLLIIDEAALIDEAEELWTSAQPTLSTGGTSIVLSCVTKDTMVITSAGIKEINEFINVNKVGGYEINKYGILGVDKVRYGTLFCNNGIQKTKVIKTKFSELECTYNHKLWGYKNKTNQYGWIESKDLEVGDFISLQYGKQLWANNIEFNDFVPSISSKIQRPFSPKKFTPDLCYLLGLYISEGSVYKILNSNEKLIGGALTITCGDNLSSIFNKLNLNYSCWDGLHYTVSNKNLIEFMEYIGFDLSKKANEKYIPSRLLELDKECIKALIQGIFDGDGCSTNKQVKLTSTSKKLINQVRMILINFGILSSIYCESKEKLNSRKGKIKHNYGVFNLEIYGRNAFKFYNSIGFRFERKQVNKNHLLNCNLDRACTKDVIPNSIELVKELIKKSGLTYYSIQKQYHIGASTYCRSNNKHKTNHISRDNVLLLYSLFSHVLDKNTIEYWDAILHDDISWCPITSISESENETFDFSLPDDNNDPWCHSVIYNGIIGHQTPRGVGNWFHKMWQAAQESQDGKIGKNGFHPIKMPWDLHPERNEEWRRIEGEKINDPKKAAQEFDCDFLASGDNVIELKIVEWFKKNRKTDPSDIRGVDHGLWVWQYPDYSRNYIISADSARGDGTDFSACHVLDAITLDQCAEYKGMLSTKDFGNFLVGLATEYNNALLIVERENIGWATLQAIIDRNYPNTFYSSSDLKYVDVQRQLVNNINTEDRKLVPGFSTNMKTRPLIISHLEQYFREEFSNGSGIKIYSNRTLLELETFIWKNGKAQAMDGFHDDLIMALGIGLWVRDTALRLRQEGIDLTKATLEHSSMNKSEVKPYYKSKATELGYKSWQMNTGRTGYNQHGNEDIRWLLG